MVAPSADDTRDGEAPPQAGTLPPASGLTVIVLTGRAQRAQHDSVATALRNGVNLGLQDGFARILTDEEPEVALLLRELVGSKAAAYLLPPAAAAEQTTRTAELTAAPLIEPLTRREKVVLRYLGSHLSNQELAGELCVSVNTLKTHLKSLYRKLDASSRSEALGRAHTLQLI